MRELGALVGRGRSADVFEYGEGRVLRRYRAPHDTEREVAAMEHARANGFPVPAAQALSSTDIVMDRVLGRTMLADLARRPWLLSRHARTLAKRDFGKCPAAWKRLSLTARQVNPMA